MIAELTGALTRAGADFVVISAGGVGYKVFVPLTTLAELPPVGTQLNLYTYTYVKEDALTLFGFSDLDQQTVFELLLTVSGVGPKVGLSILSALPVEDLVDLISRDDHISLVRVPGIGAKTAQRIVLELKEKISTLAWERRVDRLAAPDGRETLADVVEGLVALGYNRNDSRDAAERALKSIGDKGNTADLVREALKLLTTR